MRAAQRPRAVPLYLLSPPGRAWQLGLAPHPLHPPSRPPCQEGGAGACTDPGGGGAGREPVCTERDPTTEPPPPTLSSNNSKTFISPELKKIQKSLNQIESNISSLNTKIAILENEITGSSDIQIITKLGKELTDLQNQLQNDEDKWLELTQKLEKA